MIHATHVRSKAEGFEAADTITLDETQRHRRRMAMVSDGGIAFLLDLPETLRLGEGDGLVLDDGRVLRVVARPEPLYVVRGQNATHLLTLAWHLGNRHHAAQIFADHLLIRREPVLRTMLEGLGALVEEIDAAFDPEGGAYGGGASHGHAHGGPETHGGHDH
ncbi:MULTISPECIES: urease accessory protein UreE [unclassified Aureimonas]|uniref:urease accessory protein UreE n=1 Tax=unclassified Aureimonas TaxID=2615206 RepID=UPI000700D8BC|nr:MULTISPECIES: urease accessory protein UreE [unclassified Aureimonas]KQT69964.1 urease accessory protein UreE [Aureimonas sp. Leaf427]KQT75880.1 urease accessory protein UreE [Aureimonas sp. Leaf460]